MSDETTQPDGTPVPDGVGSTASAPRPDEPPTPTPETEAETDIGTAAAPASADPARTTEPPAPAEAPARAEPAASRDGVAPDAPIESDSAGNAAAGGERASGASAQDGDTPAPDAAKPDGAKPATRRRPRHANLIRAFRGKRPLAGTIEAVIKGGYEVRMGKARGFCPHSQIDLHRENEPEQHVGKTYEFMVTQLRRGGEEAVISRRALLERQRDEEGKAVRATLVDGGLTQGRVVSIADFGAFVDIGAGVLGLVHISELSHNRLRRVSDAVAVGDTIRVRVIKIDGETGKISLSLRQATTDPWDGVAERFAPGATYPGLVRRLADFGAFVELAEGVEALAPASEFPPTGGEWREGFEPGTRHDWCVLSVDPAQRRISIAPPGPAGAPTTIDSGQTLSGRVQRVEPFGVFVWIGPGKVGLMPREWTGLQPGQDLRRTFTAGSEIEVSVVDVAADGRRIRLAKPGVDVTATSSRDERGRGREPRRPSRSSGGRREDLKAALEGQDLGSFGTSLADKLRAALDGKNKDPGSSAS